MQFTITDLYAHMGIFAKLIVFVLAIMSVLSLVVMFERLFVFNKSRTESRNFAERMAAILAKGDLMAAANTKTATRLDISAASSVLALNALQFAPSPTRTSRSSRWPARSSAQGARGPRPEARASAVLATVDSTAPFIGLFGTVIGIINAFRSMAPPAHGGLGRVSAGIAEALVTTAVGLLVAIPAVMAFNYFTGLGRTRASST